MPRQNAFTLIELLVVIAIIAILAAILFPVFAQAKEAAKFSVSLSNVKQIATSYAIYTTDYDDTFPLGAVLRPAGGKLGTGVAMPYPSNNGLNNPSVWTTAPRIAMAAAGWANATYPYVKSYQLAQVNGAPNQLIFTSDTFVTGAGFVDPQNIGISFNGDLHRLSATALGSPALVPVAWPGSGKMNDRGRFTATPQLNCTGTVDDCMFNPSGAPSAAQLFPTTSQGYDVFFYGSSSFTPSIWAFSNHKAPFAFADSHAKAVPIGTTVDPSLTSATTPTLTQSAGGAFVDPIAVTNTKGTLLYSSICDGPEHVDTVDYLGYWCFFRPDRTK
jgi:prepilin-type N-terminal cleavage/methylation domain-containing protein